VTSSEHPARGDGLVEHTFRHEYARLVSRLAREFGLHRTEAAEDAAQDALMSALRTWARAGAPEQPAAWLYRVARNKLLDDLRRREHRNLSIDDDPQASDDSGNTGLALSETLADPASGDTDVRFDGEIADDELRMLFVCADESIPIESQIVLALKILCGFSTREIALRLLTSEENVQKRLARGRDRLRLLGTSFDTPAPLALQTRRESVLRVVYLMFNEGYSSTQEAQLIRRELCEEAMRLAHLLAEHPVCSSAEVDALLALMHLHAARFDARIDGQGGLLLLEEQDRSKWDASMIGHGLAWLRRSARGAHYSRYHAEAAVAVEHCLAPSFEQTNWRAIVDAYETLERFEPSPLHALNRAIAIAQWQGPAAGLEVLRAMTPPAWLGRYYLWDATLGELERRAGDTEAAQRHLQRALDAAPHVAERELIRRRLAACEPPSAENSTHPNPKLRRHRA
jgi:RNA polymerase sigma factor (sigma-70 family)